MRLNAKLLDMSWWLGRLPLVYTTASGIDSVLSVSCFHGSADVVGNDIAMQQVPPKPLATTRLHIPEDRKGNKTGNVRRT